MSHFTNVMDAHRIVEGPYKHVYVSVAIVRCKCGWRSEAEPRRHAGCAEPDLLQELRVRHDGHLEEMMARPTPQPREYSWSSSFLSRGEEPDYMIDEAAEFEVRRDYYS